MLRDEYRLNYRRSTVRDLKIMHKPFEPQQFLGQLHHHPETHLVIA